MANSLPAVKDAKKIFRTKGACSHTLFYIINRDFGHTKADEEKAADELAGGISRKGYQCGMLWGSAMAAGAEAHRISNSQAQTYALTITATQKILDAFENETGSHDCFEITDTDFSSKISMFKFMIFKAHSCFKLVEKWSPKAIAAVRAGLAEKTGDLPEKCKNCAAEIIRRKGGSQEEMAIVSGFAGGLGLSGNACGALSAAIWKNSLDWIKNNSQKSAYPHEKALELFDSFLAISDYKILCSEITEKKFDTFQQHSDFISEGGCNKIIEFLSETN